MGLLEVVPNPPSVLDWRKDKTRTAAAALILAQPAVREMLLVVRDDPRQQCSAIPMDNATAAAAAHWYRQGVESTLKTLLSLGVPLNEPEPLEETFRDETLNND